MTRALITLAAALSFLACTGTAGAWSASAAKGGRPIGVVRMTSDGTFVRGRALYICDGLVEVGWSQEVLFSGAPLGTHRISVVTGRQTRSAGLATYATGKALRVPAWAVVLVTALLPARWAYLKMRERPGRGFDIDPPHDRPASQRDAGRRIG